MGWDTFCSVRVFLSSFLGLKPSQLTGGCYYTDGNVVLSFLDEARKSVPENDPLKTSDSIIQKLKFTGRDVQGSQDLVLLVPKNEDGQLDIDDCFGSSEPTSLSSLSNQRLMSDRTDSVF